MDCLRFPSLIGIRVDATEKKLTPVSSDVFVSIPDRDLVISAYKQGESPSYLSLACPVSHSVLTYLTR